MGRIRVALVNQNCRIGRFEENLAACIDLASRASERGADIAVFPEMNLTGYAADQSIHKAARAIDKSWTDRLVRTAEKHQMVILAGLAEMDRDTGIRATHLVVTPKGEIQFYRKVHLAPQEAGTYLPGNQIRIFDACGIRFGIQLCYDAHFPELSTAMALEGADVIFMPHASPRGTSQEKLDSWMRHMTARAFDNGLYIAAVNQCGDNGGGLEFPALALVIGPDGHLKSKEMKKCPAIHMAELDMDLIKEVRSHRMRYFLPNRRTDLFS